MEYHREIYLPIQHFMFGLAILGMVSVLHALWCRWDAIVTKPFSPAHAAFCFPPLSHANSVQVYRGAINAFSTMPDGSYFKQAIWIYWVELLVVGSLVNFVFTYKYLVRLPKWTKVDIHDEKEDEEVPAVAFPDDDAPLLTQEMLVSNNGSNAAAATRLIMDHPSFVSPAVLHANEVGALVRVRRGTKDYELHGDYVRTRHVPSLGFDPTMSETELREERARLLDWVARNAPRTRNRTHSQPVIPNISIPFVPPDAYNNDGISRGVYYGAIHQEGNRHRRSNTEYFNIHNKK